MPDLPDAQSADRPITDSSTPVTAVILDYGNVLYTWEPMQAVAGYVTDEAWDEFATDGGFLTWNKRLDLGEPFEEVLSDYTSAHPNRPDWTRILALYREHFPDSLTGPVPGMAALLDDLLEAGTALYGLTNFDAEPFEQARLLVPQLERFAGIVVSGREHLAKPDAAIYELILKRYGLEAGATLFVDDSQANIRAAADMGLCVHHFTCAQRLRVQLVALGLLPAPCTS